MNKNRFRRVKIKGTQVSSLMFPLVGARKKTFSVDVPWHNFALDIVGCFHVLHAPQMCCDAFAFHHEHHIQMKYDEFSVNVGNVKHTKNPFIFVYKTLCDSCTFFLENTDSIQILHLLYYLKFARRHLAYK